MLTRLRDLGSHLLTRLGYQPGWADRELAAWDTAYELAGRDCGIDGHNHATTKEALACWRPRAGAEGEFARQELERLTTVCNQAMAARDARWKARWAAAKMLWMGRKHHQDGGDER